MRAWSGLTGAICLRRNGFEVTVVADRFAPRVTSVVAGALWEWPPAVCGQHNDLVSLSRSKQWCETGYEIFGDLAPQPEDGRFSQARDLLLQAPVAADRRHAEKMGELKAKVGRFRHDPALIEENGVNPAYGLQDAYTHLAPMVDTDLYMPWLLGEARRAGCRIIEAQGHRSAIREQEEVSGTRVSSRCHRQLHRPREPGLAGRIRVPASRCVDPRP